MADPLDDILREVARQKRADIERLETKLSETDDDDLREALELKLQKLRSELETAERGAPSATADEVGEPQEAKAPSRAALEAQARELQVALLEAAHAVERGGLNPSAADKARLKETREKLQEAMRLLGSSVGADLPPFDGELPSQPTPSQQREADNLVRNARVAKMRGQAREAADLLRRAAEAAPGAVAVQEALGDELLEQGRIEEALGCYAMALRLEPGNIAVERKYAGAIGRSKGLLDIDAALRSGLREPMLGSDAASVRAAKLMSVFLPGLGHIVIGEAQRGAAFMGGWLLMIAWASFMPDGLQSLLRTLFGGGSSFNPLVLVPMIGALAIHIGAIATVGGSDAKQAAPLKRVERPAPPVDLPFE